MKVIELRELGMDNIEEIKNFFAEVFTKEPWNDDWSNQEQLHAYITDLIGNRNSLGGGLYRAYKAQFDQLYAKQADIKNLNVLSKLKYGGNNAYWGSVVSSINGVSLSASSSGNNRIISLTISYNKKYAIVTNVGYTGEFARSCTFSVK